MTEPKFTPTEFVAVLNQTLEYAYPSVILEGEVASFKINHEKWVFFDIKDEETNINCFMPLYNLRMPIEDGMKIRIRGVPKMTKWGKFSFTVQTIQPVGEGNLKKSFELLKQKLTQEGLFNPAKKRPLPTNVAHIGVISSTQAAGYADFIKIINARWGGFKIQVAHTLVQGLDAPDQIIRALQFFNERAEVDVVVIIRGGGSADDLSAFNDEQLVRAIATSKIPVLTGIGHEIDESLADLAADIVASTPSNAAELLSRDREFELKKLHNSLTHVRQVIFQNIETAISANSSKLSDISRQIIAKISAFSSLLAQKRALLEALNPEKVLRQGYAILSGKISPGNDIEITTSSKIINANIKEIHDR